MADAHNERIAAVDSRVEAAQAVVEAVHGEVDELKQAAKAQPAAGSDPWWGQKIGQASAGLRASRP